MPVFKIFDLDGTVIDSTHRTDLARKGGSFCLDTYRNECNSPRQIARDQLLPLASYMQSLAKSGEQYAIITARYCNSADIAFLINHGLVNTNTVLMGRESVTQDVRALPDALYKIHQLNRLRSIIGADKRFIMFEDMPDILSALSVEGVTMFDAIDLNAQLSGLATPQSVEFYKEATDSRAFLRFYQQCLAGSKILDLDT